MTKTENQITCKHCKGQGDSSQFPEYSTETMTGICAYCLDEIYQPETI